MSQNYCTARNLYLWGTAFSLCVTVCVCACVCEREWVRCVCVCVSVCVIYAVVEKTAGSGMLFYSFGIIQLLCPMQVPLPLLQKLWWSLTFCQGLYHYMDSMFLFFSKRDMCYGACLQDDLFGCILTSTTAVTNITAWLHYGILLSQSSTHCIWPYELHKVHVLAFTRVLNVCK